MGLGKITREGGKVAAAMQVGLLLWDMGAAVFARIKGRRSVEPSDEDPHQIEQPGDDAGDHRGGDQRHFNP